MDVRTYMTEKLVTATGELRVLEALDLMKKHHVHRLPVVKGSRIVGLVTEKLIAQSTPSHATSLSMHELNYLLTKTTVEQIMETKVVTIHPDALLEEAAVTMREKNIGVLPVVENNQLVGIITDKDIFEAFIDILGYYQPGIRIVVELDDTPGELEKIARLFHEQNINVNQIAVYHENDSVQFVAQLATTAVSDVEQLLVAHGYKVLSAILKEGK